VLFRSPFGVNEIYYIATPVVALAAGASINFSLLTEEPDVVFRSMYLQSAAGHTTVDLYRDVTPVGGDTIVPINTDTQSSLSFPGTYKDTVTSHDGVTPVLSGALLGSSTPNTFAAGQRLINIRLEKNMQYAMTVTNSDTAGTRDISIEFSIGAAQ